MLFSVFVIAFQVGHVHLIPIIILERLNLKSIY